MATADGNRRTRNPSSLNGESLLSFRPAPECAGIHRRRMSHSQHCRDESKRGRRKTTTSVNLAAGWRSAGGSLPDRPRPARPCFAASGRGSRSALPRFTTSSPAKDVRRRETTDGRKPVARSRRISIWPPPNWNSSTCRTARLCSAARWKPKPQQLVRLHHHGLPAVAGRADRQCADGHRRSLHPAATALLRLQGLSKLFETTRLSRGGSTANLRVSGIVLCLYETGTRLAADMTDDLTRFLTASDPQSPWSREVV